MKTTLIALLIFFFGCVSDVELEGIATLTDTDPPPADAIDSVEDLVAEPDVEVEPPLPVCDAEIEFIEATSIEHRYYYGEWKSYLSVTMLWEMNTTFSIECTFIECIDDCTEYIFLGTSRYSVDGEFRLANYGSWPSGQTLTLILACDCAGTSYVLEHSEDIIQEAYDSRYVRFYYRDSIVCD